MAQKAIHVVRIENSLSPFGSIWINDRIWHQIRKSASFIVSEMTQLIEFNTKRLFCNHFYHYISFYQSYFDNCTRVAVFKPAYNSVFHQYYFDHQSTFGCGFYRVFSKMISYNMFYFILRKTRNQIGQHYRRSRQNLLWWRNSWTVCKKKKYRFASQGNENLDIWQKLIVSRTCKFLFLSSTLPTTVIFDPREWDVIGYTPRTKTCGGPITYLGCGQLMKKSGIYRCV